MSKITRSPASSPASSPAFAITGAGGTSITTWSARIAASGDDGYWSPDMDFDNSATTTKVGFDGMMFDDINSFFRFQNVIVPNAATISTATLTVVIGVNASATFDMTIIGEDVNDSAAYADETDAGDATETTANVTWSGSSSWETSDVEVSPDIKTIIQEIVNRGGWASGNDLTLRVKNKTEDSGEEYSFKTYDDSAGVSALLTIKY
tara:strand:- start:1093 stop:1713 length:621 start_codon:yes stop_codon:yes gene_type:complete